MNTLKPTAGYVIESSDPTNTNLFTSRTFRDNQPLFARQAALNHAQKLVAKKRSDEVLDIAIYLAEFDGEQAIRPYIAQIFTQRFGESLLVADAQRIEIMVNACDHDTASDLDVSIDLTKDDTAYNSPKAIWNSLGDLTCERELYYEYGYDPGFGYVTVNLTGPHFPLPEGTNVSALSDEELQQRLAKLRQPKPFSSFHILYDALPFSLNLISIYNKEYASDNGVLRFSLEFLSPQ